MDFSRDVIALRPVRPGEGLLSDPRRPFVFREAPTADLVPVGGDGPTFLVRDVPANARWEARIDIVEGLRAEPSEFELLPGGQAVLQVVRKD